jgi:hypothetical protein
MNRVQVIQALADRLGARTYLEIGVQAGDTFLRLKIRKKIGVDPRFSISGLAKLRWIRWNALNIFNEYHTTTSDQFFAGGALRGRKLDLVFVDGLHVYEQALRDIENGLANLADSGLVIVDDCNPRSAASADPVKAASQREWNGDVWKAIAFLRAARPDLDVFTLDCVYGLAIVSRRAHESRLDIVPSAIGGMRYEEFDARRTELLNLKPQEYLASFVAGLKPLREGK